MSCITMVKLGLVAALIVLLSHLVQGGHRSLKTCPAGKELRKNGQQEWKCKRCKTGFFSQGGNEQACKECRTCTHGYRKKCSKKKNAVCRPYSGSVSLADCIRMRLKYEEDRLECRDQMEVFKQILTMECQRKDIKKKHCMRKMMKEFFPHEYNSARSTLVSTPMSRLQLPPLPLPNTATKTAKAATTATETAAATKTSTEAMLRSTPIVVSAVSTLTLSAYNGANYEEQESGTQPPERDETNYVALAAVSYLVVSLAIFLLVILVRRRHVKRKMLNDSNKCIHQEGTLDVDRCSTERSYWEETLQTQTTESFNDDTVVDIPATDNCQAPPLSRTETSTSHRECSDEEQQMTSSRYLPHMVSQKYDPARQWENWARSLPISRPCPDAAKVYQSFSEGILQYPVYDGYNETLSSPLDGISDVDECRISVISCANVPLSKYTGECNVKSGPENTQKMSHPADVVARSVKTFPIPDKLVRSLAPGTGRDECTSGDTLMESDFSQSSSETEDEGFSADTDNHSSADSSQLPPPAECCLPNNSTSNTSSTPPTRLDNFTNNLNCEKTFHTRPENVYGNLFTSKGTQTKHNHENTRTIFGYEWNKSADFTTMGGHLAIPKSDITLEVPRDAVPKGESVCVQAFVSSEFHSLQPFMDDDEVVVSPVSEFQMSCKRKWDRHVKIYIPCVQRNPKETFRVRFFQKNTSGNVEFGDVPVKQDGLNQELYYVKRENHVEIFTVHFTGFFCSVCGHTCPLELLALVFGCYGHHDSEAWITLVLGDRRNSIPEVRQKIIDKEKALNGSELVAERPVRLVEQYDCQSRLMFTLHVRSQSQLWKNVDTDLGHQQVRRLRELIKCSCSNQSNVTPSELESHHQCEDNLQWVYSCDDPLPDTFSCKILVEHLLNGDVVTPRHDACNEGVTSIIVPPMKRQRSQYSEQVKSQDAQMAFGELTSSKKPLFSHGTNVSSTRLF
ncbi:uncharacterized protein [Haliotis asinina]|uniref:uncharacterized protein isoform X2 n=1 Tax=Haliotis asinina TaxID=109174 RepID=UPI00353186DF